MRTIRTKIYKFEELSAEVQTEAIENLRYLNVSLDWWNNIYYDAENIGLKITSFDLDRNKHAKGEFLQDAYFCAAKIVIEHGAECETFKRAHSFVEFWADAVKLHSDGQNINKVAEGKEYYFDEYTDEKCNDFLNDILECYADILQKECEYLQSDECVKETIILNEYEFLKDGTKF